MKRFDLAVIEGDGIAGSDTEHLVRITVIEDGRKIGSTRLPGGDFETAKAIMEGWKALADGGLDLTGMLPDSVLESE